MLNNSEGFLSTNQTVKMAWFSFVELRETFTRYCIIFLQFPRTRRKLALIPKLWLAAIHPQSVIFLLSIHRDVSRPICTTRANASTLLLSKPCCLNSSSLYISFIFNENLSPSFLHSLKTGRQFITVL